MAYRDTILAETGLVAYWDTQDQPLAHNGTGIEDYTSHLSHSGGLSNATGPLADSSFLFNTGWLRKADQPDLNITGDITLEAWVKPTDRNNYYFLVTKCNGSGGSQSSYEWRLESSSGLPRLCGPGQSVLATTAPAIGVWSHLAVVSSGNTVTHYLNGAANGSGPLTSRNDTTGYQMMIGTRGDWYSQPGYTLAHVAMWGSALTAAQISNHYAQATSAAYISAVQADSPLHYWPLQDTISTTLADSKGSLTATLTNDSGTSSWAMAMEGIGSLSSNCVYVNGNAHAATAAPPTGLPSGSVAYSLEVWFLTGASLSNHTFLGYGNYGTTNQAMGFRAAANNQLMNYWWANDLTVTAPKNFNDNYWHHAVATFDGTTHSIYLDGQLLGSRTPSGKNTVLGTNPFTIGMGYGGDNKWNGELSQVAIYNVALTQTQITNHYSAAGTGGNLRTTQVAAEAIIAPQANLRTTQVTAEAIVSLQPNVRTTQVVAEVIVAPLPQAPARGQTIIIR